MSKYTTGEIAKLCGVSVRTVQYYDTRSILVPSELSEGGRRLYSEDDLGRMKIICFLRELDLPINSIKELLAEEDSEEVLAMLLEEQRKKLCSEVEEKQKRLDKLNDLKQMLKKVEHFSMESIGDIAHIMENRQKLHRMRMHMLLAGGAMNIIEIGTLALWILKGIWWPFALGMCAVLAMAVWISAFYFQNISYICPKCHKIFRPTFRQAFWAKHTPSTRKLTCTFCGHRGFCIETYEDQKDLQDSQEGGNNHG